MLVHVCMRATLCGVITYVLQVSCNLATSMFSVNPASHVILHKYYIYYYSYMILCMGARGEGGGARVGARPDLENQK